MTEKKFTVEEIRAHKDKKAARLEQEVRRQLLRAGLPPTIHHQLEAARRRPAKPKKPTLYQWNPQP